MECPRCHHVIVQGVLFCPHCEAPLKVFLEEANPMGTKVWEYGEDGEEAEPAEEGQTAGAPTQQRGQNSSSIPVNRKPQA